MSLTCLNSTIKADNVEPLQNKFRMCSQTSWIFTANLNGCSDAQLLCMKTSVHIVLVCRYLTCMEGRSQCLLFPPPLWTAGHSPERPPWHGRIYCPKRTSGRLCSTEEVPGQTQDRTKWQNESLEESLNNDGRAGLDNTVCITLDLSVSDSKYEWFPYGTRRYLEREVLLSLILCWLAE